MLAFQHPGSAPVFVVGPRGTEGVRAFKTLHCSGENGLVQCVAVIAST